MGYEVCRVNTTIDLDVYGEKTALTKSPRLRELRVVGASTQFTLDERLDESRGGINN